MLVIICTRCDVAFVVGRLSQHMAHTTQNLWVCVKRVLRYANGTADDGFVFDGSKIELHNEWFFDADWAGSSLHQKSASGYVIIAARAAVSRKSEKHLVVT